MGERSRDVSALAENFDSVWSSSELKLNGRLAIYAAHFFRG